MGFSPTYISSIVVVIISVLNLFGIQIGSEELTKIIEGGVAMVCGIIILIRRFRHGGITLLGTTKKVEIK